MRKMLLLGVLLLAGAAQTPMAGWGAGAGMGNGLAAHVGYQQASGWLALGRVRYRWWGPGSGPGSHWLDDRNTSSRQLEVAALGGYGLPLGNYLLYGGAGLGYICGRQLGEYRYTVAKNALIQDKTYYFAYRDYQALGIPVELGLLTKPKGNGRLGIAFQTNFNPEKTMYCGVLTFWLGNFGRGGIGR